MDNEERKSKVNKCFVIACGVALTVAGFIIIPPLISKYGNKLYKSSLKNEKIDFDDMGPEIIKKDTKEKVEEEV